MNLSKPILIIHQGALGDLIHVSAGPLFPAFIPWTDALDHGR